MVFKAVFTAWSKKALQQSLGSFPFLGSQKYLSFVDLKTIQCKLLVQLPVRSLSVSF